MSRRPEPARPEQLWRASFTIEGASPPELLLALEERSLGISLFAIEEPASTEAVAWRVDMFFAEEPAPEALRAELSHILGVLPELSVEPVLPQDWVTASAMQQEPVQVGRFFVHGARDRGRVPPDSVPIEIEAGLAFGSGEHATTQACLEAINRLARRYRFRRVLDLGCGSGILAMAAARCWPAQVLASDSDPVAVRVARENVRLNDLAERIAVLEADGFRHSRIRRRAPFDLILANILADPLIELASSLARHLAPGGFAVLSGLLDRQVAAVVRAYMAQGLRLREQLDHHPWVGLVLRKPRARRALSRRKR